MFNMAGLHLHFHSSILICIFLPLLTSAQYNRPPEINATEGYIRFYPGEDGLFDLLRTQLPSNYPGLQNLTSIRIKPPKGVKNAWHDIPQVGLRAPYEMARQWYNFTEPAPAAASDFSKPSRLFARQFPTDTLQPAPAVAPPPGPSSLPLQDSTSTSNSTQAPATASHESIGSQLDPILVQAFVNAFDTYEKCSLENGILERVPNQLATANNLFAKNDNWLVAKGRRWPGDNGTSWILTDDAAFMCGESAKQAAFTYVDSLEAQSIQKRAEPDTNANPGTVPDAGADPNSFAPPNSVKNPAVTGPSLSDVNILNEANTAGDANAVTSPDTVADPNAAAGSSTFKDPNAYRNSFKVPDNIAKDGRWTDWKRMVDMHMDTITGAEQRAALEVDPQRAEMVWQDQGVRDSLSWLELERDKGLPTQIRQLTRAYDASGAAEQAKTRALEVAMNKYIRDFGVQKIDTVADYRRGLRTKASPAIAEAMNQRAIRAGMPANKLSSVNSPDVPSPEDISREAATGSALRDAWEAEEYGKAGIVAQGRIAIAQRKMDDALRTSTEARARGDLNARIMDWSYGRKGKIAAPRREQLLIENKQIEQDLNGIAKKLIQTTDEVERIKLTDGRDELNTRLLSNQKEIDQMATTVAEKKGLWEKFANANKDDFRASDRLLTGRSRFRFQDAVKSAVDVLSEGNKIDAVKAKAVALKAKAADISVAHEVGKSEMQQVAQDLRNGRPEEQLEAREIEKQLASSDKNAIQRGNAALQAAKELEASIPEREAVVEKAAAQVAEKVAAIPKQEAESDRLRAQMASLEEKINRAEQAANAKPKDTKMTRPDGSAQVAEKAAAEERVLRAEAQVEMSAAKVDVLKKQLREARDRLGANSASRATLAAKTEKLEQNIAAKQGIIDGLVQKEAASSAELERSKRGFQKGLDNVLQKLSLLEDSKNSMQNKVNNAESAATKAEEEHNALKTELNAKNAQHQELHRQLDANDELIRKGKVTEAELTNQLKAAQKEIGGSASAVSDLKSQLLTTEKHNGDLKLQHQTLSDQAARADQETLSLAKKLADSDSALIDHSAEAKSLRTSLAKSQDAVGELQSQLRTSEAQLAALASRRHAAQVERQAIIDEKAKLLKNSKGQEKQIDRLRAKTKALAQSLKESQIREARAIRLAGDARMAAAQGPSVIDTAKKPPRKGGKWGKPDKTVKEVAEASGDLKTALDEHLARPIRAAPELESLTSSVASDALFPEAAAAAFDTTAALEAPEATVTGIAALFAKYGGIARRIGVSLIPYYSELRLTFIWTRRLIKAHDLESTVYPYGKLDHFVDWIVRATNYLKFRRPWRAPNPAEGAEQVAKAGEAAKVGEVAKAGQVAKAEQVAKAGQALQKVRTVAVLEDAEGAIQAGSALATTIAVEVEGAVDAAGIAAVETGPIGLMIWLAIDILVTILMSLLGPIMKAAMDPRQKIGPIHDIWFDMDGDNMLEKISSFKATYVPDNTLLTAYRKEIDHYYEYTQTVYSDRDLGDVSIYYQADAAPNIAYGYAILAVLKDNSLGFNLPVNTDYASPPSASPSTTVATRATQDVRATLLYKAQRIWDLIHRPNVADNKLQSFVSITGDFNRDGKPGKTTIKVYDDGGGRGFLEMEGNLITDGQSKDSTEKIVIKDRETVVAFKYGEFSCAHGC